MKLFRMGFGVATVVTFLVHVAPPGFAGITNDMSHLIVFVVLTGLGALAYPDAVEGKLFPGLLVFAALIELVQVAGLSNQEAELKSFVTAALGVLVGAVIVVLVKRAGGFKLIS